MLVCSGEDAAGGAGEDAAGGGGGGRRGLLIEIFLKAPTGQLALYSYLSKFYYPSHITLS